MAIAGSDKTNRRPIGAHLTHTVIAQQRMKTKTENSGKKKNEKRFKQIRKDSTLLIAQPRIGQVLLRLRGVPRPEEALGLHAVVPTVVPLPGGTGAPGRGAGPCKAPRKNTKDHQLQWNDTWRHE